MMKLKEYKILNFKFAIFCGLQFTEVDTDLDYLIYKLLHNNFIGYFNINNEHYDNGQNNLLNNFPYIYYPFIDRDFRNFGIVALQLKFKYFRFTWRVNKQNNLFYIELFEHINNTNKDMLLFDLFNIIYKIILSDLKDYFFIKGYLIKNHNKKIIVFSNDYKLKKTELIISDIIFVNKIDYKVEYFLTNNLLLKSNQLSIFKNTINSKNMYLKDIYFNTENDKLYLINNIEKCDNITVAEMNKFIQNINNKQ